MAVNVFHLRGVTVPADSNTMTRKGRANGRKELASITNTLIARAGEIAKSGGAGVAYEMENHIERLKHDRHRVLPGLKNRWEFQKFKEKLSAMNRMLHDRSDTLANGGTPLLEPIILR